MFFVGIDGRGKMDLPEDGNGRWEMFGRFAFFCFPFCLLKVIRDYYHGGLMMFFFVSFNECVPMFFPLWYDPCG